MTIETINFIILLTLPFVVGFGIYLYRTKHSQSASQQLKTKKTNVPEKNNTRYLLVPLLVICFVIFIFGLVLFVSNMAPAEISHDHEEQEEMTQPMTGIPCHQMADGTWMGDCVGKETMDMPGMVPLDDLPLEEPHSTLDPVTIQENGKEIKVFHIWIEAIKKEIRPGVYVEMWGFNRQVPGPELRINEGDNVRVIFENKHTFNHTIHWHGQHVPYEMDGVPGVNQETVEPNKTYTYDFIAGPSGTHIYHCHVDTHHHTDMGMYGPFIVEDPQEDLTKYDQEVTWMLSSFTTTAQHHHDQAPSPYFSGHQIYTAEHDAFMINGKAFPGTTPIQVNEGDLIKMRMINIGKEPYSMHIHGHSFTVTHKDGFPIAYPQEMDTLPLLPGERYDLEIHMKNKGFWVFHDHITQHVTNAGFYPGGMLSTIIYEGFSFPQYLQDYLASIQAYNTKATALGRPPEQAMSTEDHSDH